MVYHQMVVDFQERSPSLCLPEPFSPSLLPITRFEVGFSHTFLGFYFANTTKQFTSQQKTTKPAG